MPASEEKKLKKVFNYASLDVEVSQYVQQRTGEIRSLMKRTAQDIIEIGQRLISVKEKLGHGCFLDWIEAEFEWSYPTAARFIQVANYFSKNYQIDKFAPSALYLLAAPSTPETARSEAIALAASGEQVTYTTAKAIKQKYSPGGAAKQKKQAQAQVMPAMVVTGEAVVKQEVVAIRPQRQVSLTQVIETSKEEMSAQVFPNLAIYTPSPQSLQQSEQPSSCWQLGTRHILYCGDPNSPQFLQQIPETVGLLLAFPPDVDWESKIQAETRIIATRCLPQGKDIRLFEDTIESILLLYSKVGEKVVICFLPSPEILSIVNRLDRYGIFVEPNPKLVHEIISDWRASGLKAERVNH